MGTDGATKQRRVVTAGLEDSDNSEDQPAVKEATPPPQRVGSSSCAHFVLATQHCTQHAPVVENLKPTCPASQEVTGKRRRSSGAGSGEAAAAHEPAAKRSSKHGNKQAPDGQHEQQQPPEDAAAVADSPRHGSAGPSAQHSREPSAAPPEAADDQDTPFAAAAATGAADEAADPAAGTGQAKQEGTTPGSKGGRASRQLPQRQSSRVPKQLDRLESAGSSRGAKRPSKLEPADSSRPSLSKKPTKSKGVRFVREIWEGYDTADWGDGREGECRLSFTCSRQAAGLLRDLAQDAWSDVGAYVQASGAAGGLRGPPAAWVL